MASSRRSHMDDWLKKDLDERRDDGLHRVRRRLQSAQGARVRLGGRDFLNFTSNDYLGYAADPRLAKAAARAAREYGCGAGSSALVSGWSPPLRALERDLAAWEGAEAALVFSSGFAANLALVTTLVGNEDAIFSDFANHASLIDGCRLSRAAIHIYRHVDLNHLAEMLRAEAAKSRRRLIVTDSVFSMDGDLAPLAALLDLAERFDCMLLVDEAHATGVLGARGRGASDDLSPSLATSRLLKVGTLSKALGAQGGFVSGSRVLIDALVNRARPYIFSTALAPPLAAAARRAVQLIQKEPDRRRRVLRLAEALRAGLRAAGFDVGESRCQIVPLIIGTAKAAMAASSRLEEVGYLVPAIRPPSVPQGTSRLRISLTAGHTEEDVAVLTEAIVAKALIQ